MSADIPEQVFLDAGAARARVLIPYVDEVEVQRYAQTYAESEGHRAAVASAYRAALAEAAERQRRAAEQTGWFLTNDDLRERERAAYERGRAAALADEGKV